MMTHTPDECAEALGFNSEEEALRVLERIEALGVQINHWMYWTARAIYIMRRAGLSDEDYDAIEADVYQDTDLWIVDVVTEAAAHNGLSDEETDELMENYRSYLPARGAVRAKVDQIRAEHEAIIAEEGEQS